MNNPKIFDYLWKHFSFIGNQKGTGSMFYHQKVARVRVFADIQNFALLRTACMAFPQYADVHSCCMLVCHH